MLGHENFMENRLNQKIKETRRTGRKLFCVFLTFGYPSVKATGRLILSAEKSGVDVIELGFPFSDPLADGPTIQRSSEQALKKGVTIKGALDLVAGLRKKGCKVPIVFFGYLNPVFSYGEKAFARDAREAGFDGAIIPDLPPEEEKKFQVECGRKKLHLIDLVAPTTPAGRAKMLAAKSRGFIYYVSLRGVTGARRALPTDLAPRLKKLRRMTKKPVLVGFGVSTPEQARGIARIADGVIVGSAVINELKKSVPAAERFIGRMSKAVHTA